MAASLTTLHLDDTTFQKTISGTTLPVLVDFWAAWCPPCRLLGPTIDQLGVEQQGKAVIAKLDVDAAGETAEEFGVQSIPTIIIFKNGQEVDRMVGVQPKQEIERRLAQAAR
jgi:thioredoxin 1